jgi:hypothetical protein
VSTGQSIRFQAFWLPKRGNAVEEYEDAHHGAPERGRFAIADGASESSFAAQWARLLVEAFVEGAAPQPGPWSNWLPAIQQQWQAEVGGRELPWYAETKVQQGAFATFLGVAVKSHAGIMRTRRRWLAVAVGDSCLFQVRAGKLRRAFPIERARDFSNAPWLVGSRGGSTALEEKTVRGHGDWAAGDRLWLMTDALAQWFLEVVEAGHRPWEALEPLLSGPQPEARFAEWIEALRQTRALRNDDVTLEAVGL